MSYTPESERLGPVLIPLGEALGTALPKLQEVLMERVKSGNYSCADLQNLEGLLADMQKLYRSIYITFL